MLRRFAPMIAAGAGFAVFAPAAQKTVARHEYG
jgi:hypothetical protein